MRDTARELAKFNVGWAKARKWGCPLKPSVPKLKSAGKMETMKIQRFHMRIAGY